MELAQVPYQKSENEYESPAVQQILESRGIPGENAMRGERSMNRTCIVLTIWMIAQHTRWRTGSGYLRLQSVQLRLFPPGICSWRIHCGALTEIGKKSWLPIWVPPHPGVPVFGINNQERETWHEDQRNLVEEHLGFPSLRRVESGWPSTYKD